MRTVFLVSIFLATIQAQPHIHLGATLRAGQSFHKDIGPDLVFALDPIEDEGWVIQIQPKTGDASRQSHSEDYIRCVTGPSHGPHPADLFAWHFVSEDNQIRLPKDKEWFGRKRDFNFVLNAADQEKACDELEAESGPGVVDPKTGALTLGSPDYKVPPLGAGIFWIKAVELSNLGIDKHARLESLTFEVDIDLAPRSQKSARPK
jgi:hypothetical protein